MKLEQALAEAEACAMEAHDAASSTAIRALSSWLLSPAAHVVFCGEFNRGKSSLVNALIGEAICPEDSLPATAVPMVLEEGARAAAIHYVNGHVEPIDPTLAALDGLSVGSERSVDDVQFVKISLPIPFLSGLSLIDTPGVNDLSQQRADVTYRFLPLCDAAVVVLDSTAPVTASETLFLKDRVFPEVMDRVVFVLGKCDRLDEEERDDAVRGAQERLRVVTGRDVPVLAASTRLGPGYLDAVRDAIGDVVSSAAGRRSADAAGRLNRILHQLRDDVLATIAVHEESVDRKAALDELNGLKEVFADRYQGMRGYLDGYGRETLKELVRRSLDRLRVDLLGELQHDIESSSGDFDRFLGLQAPRRIEVRLKQWSERKAPEMEMFLRKLVTRVAEDFERMFLVPLDRASLPASFSQPDVELERSKSSKSRTEAFVKESILPSAVAMGAGFLILGPLGIAAGAMLGQVAGVHLRERKAEAERQEALEAISTMTTAVIDGFEHALAGEIDQWFNALEDRLRQGLAVAKSRASQRLLTTSTVDDLQAIDRRLTTLINQLEATWPTS